MSIITKAEFYIQSLFKDKLSSSYLYHNLFHTQKVVQSIKDICEDEKIDEQTTEKLLLAGWFHDIGYVYAIDKHEERSVEFLKEFLENENYEEDYINETSSYILATILSYTPETKNEKIIRDADYNHFASIDYQESGENLRKEWQLTCSKQYSDLEWYQNSLDFMQNKHHYYTDFAKKYYQPIKEQNIQKIMEKIEELEHSKNNKKEKKKKKEKESSKYDRGVETMFRTTLNNHTRLSEIADNKANILLSVNTIIISIVLSILIPKLDNITNEYLATPTFVLVTFSVISIVFAILSTRPKINNNAISPEDIKQKKVNLLFFGNFSKLSLNEYEEAINDTMRNSQEVYNSMIKDLYFLGLVLNRKYKLLRITYNIFMIGIIISVIAFIVAYEMSKS